MKNEKKSDFGRGFIYNIVLFSKHWWHFEDLRRNDEMARLNPDLWKEGEMNLWFNGAGDHFFELEIPKKFKGTKIGKLAQELKYEAIERRLGHSTKEEFDNFFSKLEKLCIMIDQELGVKDIKSLFE